MRDFQIWLVHFLGYLILAFWGLAVYESFPYLATHIGLTDPDTIRYDGARAGWLLFCFFVGYSVIAPKFSQFIVTISDLKDKEEGEGQDPE